MRLLTVEQLIGAVGPIPPGVKWVAFQTENRITNTGPAAWTDDKGLLSIWILAMFPPAADTRVVVPFDAQAQGPIVNDSYFGKVPSDRLTVHEREGYVVRRRRTGTLRRRS